MAKKSIHPESDLPTGAPIDGPAHESKPEPPRGRQSVAPECPYHPGNVAVAYHSSPWLTYYRCPVPDCSFRIKISRPVRSLPEAEPEEFSAR